MTYSKPTLTQIRGGKRPIEEVVYDMSEDLDTRVGVLESSVTQNLASVTGDVTFSSLVTAIGAKKVKNSMVDDNAIDYRALDSTSRTYKLQMRHAVAEATAATDFEKSIGVATAAGTVTGVKFIPDATFGQVTDYATLSIINKGAAGSGNTSVASKAYSTSAAAYVASTLTLGSAGNLVIASGDVLTLKKTHSGNGQLVPVGELQISIERSA